MPQSSAEQLKRVLPNVVDVEWSGHTLNLQYYNKSRKAWTYQKKGILNSFHKDVRFKKLKSSFGYWNKTTNYQVTEKIARILDLASSLFFLSDLESEPGRKMWQIDSVDAEEVLNHLRSIGIIDGFYWFSSLDFTQLLSRVYLHFEGPENLVCSVTDALLKYLPTSLARIADRGKSAHIISRVPAGDKIEFANLLVQASKDRPLKFRYAFPSTHRNYQTDFYQRLLNPDGTWNSDISAFLSQIRSAPKSTSVENES